MTRFDVLGTLDLRGPDGSHVGSPISGSKRLGLLAYLTLAHPRGFHRRDTVVGLFWPETDQKHARNALSNMLHQLRRSLGPEVVETRGTEEVGIVRDRLRCDALAFEEALEEGRPAEALELYRGDLLEGLYVGGASPRFDHWLTGERGRLRTRAAEAARGLIRVSERAEDLSEAIRWARRAVQVEPLDERAVRDLMALYMRDGNPVAARRAYDELADALAREFEMEPSAETLRVLETGSNHPLGLEAGQGGTPGGSPDESTVPSIAVLPFTNLSGAPEAEPFVAGLHDDLITELSRTPGLTVISRSSVMRFQEGEQSAGEIARALGVAALVEGGVQSGQGRIRVNAKLIDPRGDTHIWANRYDRTLTPDGLFDIQVELAREIARAAHAEMSPPGRDQRQPAPTESLEAYRLCAQGRDQLDQRTERGMRAAAALFREAVLEDRSYTLAWVGLADSLTLLFDYGYERGNAVLPEAEEALETAMELEPGSAEAQASLGLLYANRRRGPDAILALQRAVELRPGYAEAHNWLSWVSQVMGRAPEALASARQAVKLDPLSPEAISNLALSLLENGHAGAALREARCARDLQPDWDTPAFYQGLALYHLDRFAEARRVLEGLLVPWAGSGPKVTLALTHLALHEESRAREMLAEFAQEKDRFAVGLLRAALGEPDRAFEAFLEGTDWGYWPVFSVHHFYPRVLGPLRKDPRFSEVLEKAKRSWGG